MRNQIYSLDVCRVTDPHPYLRAVISASEMRATLLHGVCLPVPADSEGCKLSTVVPFAQFSGTGSARLPQGVMLHCLSCTSRWLTIREFRAALPGTLIEPSW